MHSIFWPPLAVRIWGGPSALSLGEAMILSNSVLDITFSLCACVYFAYYQGSFFVVGLSSDLNCCEDFVAVVVVYAIYLE